MPEWRLGKLGDELCLVFYVDGKRKRYRLGTSDKIEAEQSAAEIYAELTRPESKKVSDLWKAYCKAKEGRSVVTTMEFTWKALENRFGKRDAESITQEDCEEHTRKRRAAGIKDGTIHTELGHLRTVLTWAEKRRLIDRAPHIERPSKPRPRERHLSREEFAKLLQAASTAHIELAMRLLIGTGARVTALLELKWDRVDLDRRFIHLADPEDGRRLKGRASVPIGDGLAAALRRAKEASLSDYVIEWAGEPVKSIKRGIKSAAKKAGIEDVSPHVFRHSAAVWLAESGKSMPDIAQFLGHSDSRLTERVYARFSPEYHRDSARILDVGLYEVLSGSPEPAVENRKGT